MSIYTTPTYKAYVRLLLKGERKAIEKVLMDVGRIHGDKQREGLRAALNLEMSSNKAAMEPPKPTTSSYEQTKAALAASLEITENTTA